MKRASYELPMATISEKENDGINNQGFQADLPEGGDKKVKPAFPQDKQSIGQSDKRKELPTDDNDVDDIYCGVGSCRPHFMQGCKNMVCFSAIYSFVGIVTSGLSSYINSQITTLEKHFNMSSSMSGFIMSCNDIGYLATTLYISYYARRLNIPRALACNTMLYGVSGVLCAMAFFLTKDQLPSLHTATDNGNNLSLPAVARVFTQTCQNFSTSPDSRCNQVSGTTTGSNAIFEISDRWRTIAICIIATGMILQGVAKSPRHAFLGTYVDDNLPRTKTAVYLGVMTGMSIFGPAGAYALGGVFSSMYITLEETNISPRDPRWLGAWWLGFLLFGAAGLIVGFPLILFPRRMRKQKTIDDIKKTNKVDKIGLQKWWHDVKDLLKSVIYLIINPVFSCMMFANGLNMLSVSGMMAFLPKYMETQFSVTAAKANIFLGAAQIVASPLGTVIGGYVTSRLKLSPKGCLKLMIGLKCLGTAVSGLSFVFGCNQPVVHMGLVTNSISPTTHGVTQCVQGCHCDDKNYFPICGEDGKSYFSPCHAGCLSMDDKKFNNCSCMTSNETQNAVGGLCVQDCGYFYPYVALIIVASLIGTMTIMPNFIVVVRSVKEEDKPLAIGLNAFAGTLMGWLPGPVIFGFLVDSTCMLWKSTCSSTGACSLYNIELFLVRFQSLSMSLKLATLVLYVIALMFAVCSKKPVFQPHEDEISLTITKDHSNGAVESEKDSSHTMQNKTEHQETQKSY